MAPSFPIRKSSRAAFRPGSVRYHSIAVPGPIDPFLQRVDMPSGSGRRLNSSPARPSSVRRPLQATVDSSAPSFLGIKPWFAMVTTPLFGQVGEVRLNVASGNMVTIEKDLAFPFRGTEIALTRYHNSQSAVNVTTPRRSMFGNGWSSELDQHLQPNTSGGISYFDDSGARWDFTPGSGGTWISPPGLSASLQYYAPGNQYWLTDVRGTVTIFASPLTCPVPVSMCGRPISINPRWGLWTYTISYTFAPNSSGTLDDMQQVDLATDYGDHLTLALGNGNGHHLVTDAYLTPSGSSQSKHVVYGYDSTGNMIYVSRPGNDSATSLSHTITYWGGTQTIQTITSPIYDTSWAAHGGRRVFFYDGSVPQRVTEIDDNAEVNLAPQDGFSNSYVNPGAPTGTVDYHDTQFNYRNSGETDVTTTDGLSEVYYIDTSSEHRPYYVARYSNGAWNTLSWTFDSSNHVSAVNRPELGGWVSYQFDASGFVTRTTYPTIAYNGGSATPTSESLYDSYGHLLAFCDAQWVHDHGGEGLSQNICSATSSGAWSYTYANMWLGVPELTTVTHPSGATVTFGYDISSEGGSDYALPTSITGTQTQQFDSTFVTPSTSIRYDGHGRVTWHAVGGSEGQTFTYDAFGRVIQETDADGVPRYNAYNADDSVTYTENYLQHFYDQYYSPTYMTSYRHDGDGNLVGFTDNVAGAPAVTSYYYDGVGRQVEVVQPATGGVPDSSRFVYDSSKGHQIMSASGVALTPHGGLFARQRYVNSTWVDTNLREDDTLGRPDATWSFAVCNSGSGSTLCPNTALKTTLTYSPATTFLTSTTNALQQTRWFSYDPSAHVSQISFSDGVTPAYSYGYDLSDRVVSASTSGISGQYQYAYTGGRLMQKTEPSGSWLRYTYNPDGNVSSVKASDIDSSNPILSYAYSGSGRTTDARVQLAGAVSDFRYSYTAAGRLSTITDPGQTASTTSLSYGADGGPSAVTMPQGQYYGLFWNFQNNLSQYHGYGGEIVNLGYDAGGHMVSENFIQNPSSWPGFTGTVQAGTFVSPGMNYDARNGAVFRTSDDSSDVAYTYDNSLRLLQISGYGPNGQFSKTNTFDSENHLTGSTVSNLNYAKPTASYCGATSGAGGVGAGGTLGVTYTWDVEGKPVRRRASTYNSSYNESLHWSGDTLLYTKNEVTGAVDNIKLGFGEAFGGRLYAYDRDPIGGVASTHTSPTAFDSWRPADPFLQNCLSPLAPPSTAGYVPLAPPIQSTGTSGLFDGVNVLQGDRPYELLSKTMGALDPLVDFGGTSFSFADNAPNRFGDPTGNFCQALAASTHVVWDGNRWVVLDACGNNLGPYNPAGPPGFVGLNWNGPQGPIRGGGGGGLKLSGGLPKMPCIIPKAYNYVTAGGDVALIKGVGVSVQISSNGTVFVTVSASAGADLHANFGIGHQAVPPGGSVDEAMRGNQTSIGLAVPIRGPYGLYGQVSQDSTLAFSFEYGPSLGAGVYGAGTSTAMFNPPPEPAIFRDVPWLKDLFCANR